MDNNLPKDKNILVQDKPIERNKKSLLVTGLTILVFIVAYGVSYSLTHNLFSLTNSSSDKVASYFTDTSATWKDFNSTNGNFEVNFPVYPAHDTSPLNVPGLSQTVNLDTYSASDSNGNDYAVAYASYPTGVDVSKPEDNLQGALNGTLQNTNATLISSNFSTYQGSPALDYTAQVKDKNYLIKGKDVLIGSNFYSLITVYPSTGSTTVQYDKFINSFQVR